LLLLPALPKHNRSGVHREFIGLLPVQSPMNPLSTQLREAREVHGKMIAHKWNTGFSHLDHRIYPILRLNKSIIGITLSPASQINLAIPAESIRRSRLFNALMEVKRKTGRRRIRI
jgi:hypothetical protein